MRTLIGASLLAMVAVMAPSVTAEQAAHAAADGGLDGARRISAGDAKPGHTQPDPRPIAVGDRVAFVAYSDQAGDEVWVSDGTASGTHLLVDALPGVQGSEPRLLRVIDDRLYFSSNTSDGPRLWVSDGTTAGTRLVADVNVGTVASGSFLPVGPLTYFTGIDDVHGAELWVTDGTDAGTRMIKDIDPRPGQGSGAGSFGRVGDQVLFVASTPETGGEVWRTDGTAAGTSLVLDADAGPMSSVGTPIVFTSDRMFYVGQHHMDLDGDGDIDSGGRELWSSDGTAGGTGRVRDIFPGTASSLPGNMTALNDRLVFTANSADGREVWASDGTAAGTVQLGDLAPGPGGSDAAPFAGYAEAGEPRLMFRARTGEENGFHWKLFSTDGTPTGTRLVKDVRPAGELSFAPSAASYGDRVIWEITVGRNYPYGRFWVSDGTAAGTYPFTGEAKRSNVLIAGDFLYWYQFTENPRRAEIWAAPLNEDQLAAQAEPASPAGPVAPATTLKQASSTAISVTSSRYGEARARVSVSAGRTPAAGAATVQVDGRSIGSVTLRAGRAEVALPRWVRPGLHRVLARYRGTAAVASSAAETRIRLERATTTTTGRARTVRVSARRPVLRVRVVTRGSRPIGRVEVRRHGVRVAGGSVSSDGVVRLRLPRLRPGRHTVVVRYGGSALHAPSKVRVSVRVRR